MALTRFGVAMESSLLTQFDHLVKERQTTRSEVLRDLVRAEIVRSLATKRVEAFASVTIVYNHHVRELSERLTEMQHELGDQVRSTMHVHLDAERCLEVIVMRGRADRLQRAAEVLFATRGVVHGSIEVVADTSADERRASWHAHPEHGHPRSKEGSGRRRPSPSTNRRG
ncbi:MAG: nickel-responsive transcriptional regulator NikR [Polyangiaceae bacterium]|jgi:CopG family nickel-responsive transcriptional regulator